MLASAVIHFRDGFEIPRQEICTRGDLYKPVNASPWLSVNQVSVIIVRNAQTPLQTPIPETRIRNPVPPDPLKIIIENKKI